MITTDFLYRVSYSIGTQSFVHYTTCRALSVRHGRNIVVDCVHNLFQGVENLNVLPL